MLGQPVDHGAEVESRGSRPVGQDLTLPIERQVVRELRDQHLVDGAFGRQSALVQSRRGERLAASAHRR